MDRFHLLNMEKILEDLEGCLYFTTLDLFSGYWKIPLAEHCKDLTTFICNSGTFRSAFMPFGLVNAPTSFQKMVNEVLK